MRYDNLDETYENSLPVGCWGCFFYLLLFFTAGGIILYLKKPIIWSVVVMAIFAFIWFIGFMLASRRDKKKRDNERY